MRFPDEPRSPRTSRAAREGLSILDAPRGAKGLDYHSLKDLAMAEAADYGLMLWDGKSKGTVSNVVNLSRDHKPVVVYVTPTKHFQTIKTADDLRNLLAQGDSDSVERIVSELHLSEVQQRAAGVAALTGPARG